MKKYSHVLRRSAIPRQDKGQGSEIPVGQDAAYKEMAADSDREEEALEWTEVTCTDINDDLPSRERKH